VNTSGTEALSQTNLQNIFTSSNYTKLTSLLSGSGQYVPMAANGAGVIPNVGAAPASLAKGDIWYNTTTNQLSTTMVLQPKRLAPAPPV
jgi:hypothetical protein